MYTYNIIYNLLKVKEVSFFSDWLNTVVYTPSNLRGKINRLSKPTECQWLTDFQ